MLLGSYPNAISDSTYALKLIPEKPENAMLIYWARMARGGGHIKAGMFNQAVTDFDAIMKFRSDISTDWLSATYQYRGHAYFRSGRYREAVDDYTQNIAFSPEKRPDVYRNLGLAYHYLVPWFINSVTYSCSHGFGGRPRQFDLVEHNIQIVSSEFPFKRFGDLFVIELEPKDPFFEHFQRFEVIG